MRERLAGDGLGVLAVGLGSAAPAASFGGAVGLDLAGVVAGGGEGENQRPAEEGRALDPDRSRTSSLSMRKVSNSSMPASSIANERQPRRPPQLSTTATVAVLLCGSIPATPCAWSIVVSCPLRLW